MTPAQELKALLLLRRLVAAWARDYHCCWLAQRGGNGDRHSDDCPWAAADEFLKEIGA